VIQFSAETKKAYLTLTMKVSFILAYFALAPSTPAESRSYIGELIETVNHEGYKRSHFSHPFLSACREGTIDAGAFDTWLVQDLHFGEYYIKKFTPELAKIAKEGSEEQEVLKLANDHEIAWFHEKIAERGLNVAEPLPANKRYMDWLDSILTDYVQRGNFAVGISVFYGVEKVYQKAWNQVLHSKDCPEWLTEFAENWGSEGFGKFVDVIESFADKALETASEEDKEVVAGALKEIFALENEFWSMAHAEGIGTDENGSGHGHNEL